MYLNLSEYVWIAKTTIRKNETAIRNQFYKSSKFSASHAQVTCYIQTPIQKPVPIRFIRVQMRFTKNINTICLVVISSQAMSLSIGIAMTWTCYNHCQLAANFQYSFCYAASGRTAFKAINSYVRKSQLFFRDLCLIILVPHELSKIRTWSYDLT